MNVVVKNKTRPAIYSRGKIVVEYHAEKMFAEWLANRGVDFSSNDGKVVEFKFDPDRRVGHDGQVFNVMCCVHNVHQHYNCKLTKEQQKIVDMTKGQSLRILTKWEKNQ